MQLSQPVSTGAQILLYILLLVHSAVSYVDAHRTEMHVGLCCPQDPALGTVCCFLAHHLLLLLSRLQACQKHSVAPGVFCLGQERAAQLAQQGYKYVAYDTDLGVLINYASSTMANLRK